MMVFMINNISLHWYEQSTLIDQRLRQQIVDCWRDVSNAGGAVGFPYPPVSQDHVRPYVDSMISSMESANARILVALDGEKLAGWLLLSANSFPLTAHWALVQRVQTDLAFRSQGIGKALMQEVARFAAEDLGLRQLRLDLRSGLGLEEFYGSLGWKEVGRWPDGFLPPEGFRDEVLMQLELRPH